MIVDQTGGRKVTVRRRDPDSLERIEEVIEAYPYLFIPEGMDEYGLVRTQDGYEGLYGEALKKAFFRTEWDRGEWRRNTDRTWEGQVSFPNQVLNDRLAAGKEPYPNYEHRVWYVDGEWKAESEEVTMLSAYDSYTGKMFTWVQHPDIPAGMHKTWPCKDHPEGLTEVVMDPPMKAFANERQLLADFAAHMRKQDPDILTGWFFVDADVSTISTRMRRLGLDPKIMSPHRQHNFKYSWTEKRWTQPIPGRLCFDLMVGFKKLWTIKNGQLAARKLDDVAEFVLGEKKVELPNGHDTYYTDVGTYLDYNRQDVRLLPRLDQALNVLGYYTSLQHLIQCELASTPMVTVCATSLFVQDEDFAVRIPDSPQFAKVEYQGADVQDVVPGRYQNMAIMDIKAMYHSNVNLHNISWDTLSDDGVDCGNGIRFTQGEQGVLGRTMDKLTVKRNEYKALLKEAKATGNLQVISKWDAMQFATKSMVASLYGICGDSKFGMYHPDIAAAITHTSRQTLFRLRDECNDRGYPVRYGHTDSIFCEVPTPEEGMVLCEAINESMAPIEVEFEKWCSTMILKAKNRYAGKTTWADGSYLDEPQYYYKGLELKQARMPKAMKQAMDEVLRGILDGTPQEDVDARLLDLIEDGKSGALGESLLMVGKLTKPLSSYRTLGGPVAGVKWAQDTLGLEFEVGGFYLAGINRRGRYMAFHRLSDIDGVDEVDWAEMTERFIVNKARDVYALVDWDTTALTNAMRGIGRLEWL